MLLDKIVEKFCNSNIETWECNDSIFDDDFNPQCIFSYGILLQLLNKILRTYPTASSLLLLFKSRKLKHFSSFSDFLVRKIYPIGFLKWAKHDPANPNQNPPEKFQEKWRITDIRDTKGESPRTEDTQLYRVSWEKNLDWESTIVENMRTLIDFNIFMNPQEKKIKLEIKKHLIAALIEKTSKVSWPLTLRDVTILSTNLILLRKLLTVSEPSHPLCYNKENVCHTIKELKSSNKIFRIVSELMRCINPLSPESEIVDPLLIPLIGT